MAVPGLAWLTRRASSSHRAGRRGRGRDAAGGGGGAGSPSTARWLHPFPSPQGPAQPPLSQASSSPRTPFPRVGLPLSRVWADCLPPPCRFLKFALENGALAPGPHPPPGPAALVSARAQEEGTGLGGGVGVVRRRQPRFKLCGRRLQLHNSQGGPPPFSGRRMWGPRRLSTHSFASHFCKRGNRVGGEGGQEWARPSGPSGAPGPPLRTRGAHSEAEALRAGLLGRHPPSAPHPQAARPPLLSQDPASGPGAISRPRK